MMLVLNNPVQIFYMLFCANRNEGDGVILEIVIFHIFPEGASIFAYVHF